MCQQLAVPVAMQTSVRLLQETRAMLALENEMMALLDYGGISTNDAESAIKRASKGGMVGAKQLRGLVATLAGADRLKRQVGLVARQNNATQRNGPLGPLLDAVAAVRVPAALMRDINAAINEDGELADSSSEQVRTTRGRVRAITSRINNILKGYPGEASEKSGRLCIAVPAGTRINNGVMLGSSVGGGLTYIEPAQVVSLNNELMAARAEAMAAEEAVLWELSGRLMGCLEDVETAFSIVGWLDVLSAKVRFGMWMGAVMPQFTPWDEVFHTRSGAALRKQQQQQQQGSSAVDWDAFASAGAAAGAAVHLRRLSHPLLLADYLEERQQLERQARMAGYAAASSSSSEGGSSSSSSGKKISSRMLGTRKEVLYKQMGLDFDSSSSSGKQQAANPQEALAALKPPRPIELVAQPETSVVVITGPNTGGKTAAMKAFGLAACMAKAGLLLPAQAPARLPCFSCVLADIGDEQSLTANLSTFSGHIKRISALRAEADGRSLLLLDELGTGTDPVEGAALGQALLQQLIKGGIGNGALTIATTHHSIMTQLKFEDPRAENASVEFDEEALAPTYKLLWGVPGRSNALNIASRLGLDPTIVAAARQRLAAGVAAANSAIEELEGVQETLRQADAAAFAVEADLQQTKTRLEGVKQLVISTQQGVAMKRAAAIREVQSAARALLKALKLERKARFKGNTSSKIGRQLDLAMGDDMLQTSQSNNQNNMSVTTAAISLDAAMESFRALEASSAGGSSAFAYDALLQQRRQQQQQQWQQQEEWVQDWARLLEKARSTLRESLASSSSSSVGVAGGSLEEDYEAEVEAELQALAAKAAQRDAALQAEIAAAQQLIESQFEAITAAAAATDAASQDALDAAVDAVQKRKRSTDEAVSQELFAAGVSLVEEALEADQQLAALMAANGAAQQAQAAAQAEEAARQQAEQAMLMAAMESELEQWDIDALLQATQQQQQQEEAAAAAAASAAKAEAEAAAAAAAAEAVQQQQQQLEMQQQQQQQGQAKSNQAKGKKGKRGISFKFF
ncbi:hypothetical protein OEZ85_000133 [Tetradesmus obliquus]|uniref:DNA mismatch repair proteins mutS family domain-containing protein n=1 Tax=Tetradesmus obliquus TaxID=3088 RepID=A0ABY8UQ36_TETOB|nr:hypothetical protein OEZ85_000133 [Tetradesmus obliquus]